MAGHVRLGGRMGCHGLLFHFKKRTDLGTVRAAQDSRNHE